MTLRPHLIVIAGLLAGIVIHPALAEPLSAADSAQVRSIAKEAYIYGFPLVDNYRIQHSYFVDKGGAEYKGDWNQIHSTARVYTPEDKAIQTPNSDTPYSFLGADLRTEPLVITVPAVDEKRYYSAQFIDQYTFNFAYIGSRATGSEPGSFLLAGPDWDGEKPAGVKEVIRCETRFAFVLFRTQLLGPDDLEEVIKVQAGFKVQPLSSFLGKTPPDPAPKLDFITPLSAEDQRKSPDFFRQLGFVLRFCPPHPSETEMLKRFAKLGIGANGEFDPKALSPELLEAVQAGIADAWEEFNTYKIGSLDTGKKSSADGFGTREFLNGDYLGRMSSAVLGIYGNSKEEALYPVYFIDSEGKPLDGENEYTLRFPPGQLPPVNSFWSLTLYQLPSSLLYANRLNRYLINSAMLPQLKKDADGGITLHLQKESPGAGKESNWLPAPEGPFFAVLRLYWPKPAALNGEWTAPKLQRVSTNAGGAVPVTQKTYARAENDRMFAIGAKQAGGVNRFTHIRTVTPIDGQTAVRMNRDVLYSSAVVDTEKGATLTVPEMPDGRYFSVLMLDNDHYCPGVIYTSGKHELPQDTKYLGLILRIHLVDPNDPADVALVNQLQDQFVIEAASADPFPKPEWDQKSLDELTAEYKKEFDTYEKYPDEWMAPRGVANDATRHIAVAGAWGLFPNKDALYINYDGDHPSDQGFTATYAVPENEGFWSITVYGPDGYMKHENCVLNQFNTKFNDDGTFTVHFGSKEQCGDVPNRLDVPEDWNFLMRVYRPGKAVLDGSYQLPKAVPVDPLSSWNEGKTKSAILSFVRDSVNEGGPGFLEPADRIAVFDMDGTLVVEEPYPIVLPPIFEAVQNAVKENPEAMKLPGISEFLSGDRKAIARIEEKANRNVIAVAYAGRPVDDVTKVIREQLANAIHPRFKRPLSDLQYQPMLELLELLRKNGFQTWISSGSPVNITRQISAEMFGIPREQVLGTTVQTEFVRTDGPGDLVFGEGIEHINDTDFKPVTIYRAIGRRPAFVAGNVGSGGDVAMMEFSRGREGPSFQLMINHDDDEREYSYAESDGHSLGAAKDFGFHVASIKDDWKVVLKSKNP